MDIARIVLRQLAPAAAVVAYASVAAPVAAAERLAFDVAPGRLDLALVTFARQARVSINVDDPGLRDATSPGVRGRFTVAQGLRRLLRGSGYDFRIVDGTIVRIVRTRVPRRARPAPSRPAPSRDPAPPPPPPPPEPIVVTASKRDAELADYPASAHVATLSPSDGFRLGGSASQVLLRALPDLSSTGLGPGRNKIFIRGIADSSFNGQSQATVSQYLGESRLIYSAPDPDLALYDIERLEVLEGPQGTLYGAGSLGGVIRLVPREPEPGKLEVSGTGALSVTKGELGGDGAVVGNVPLGGPAALRVVGYRIVQPGYIDDPARRVRDINRTDIRGLRATVRFEPAAGLTADVGIVAQDVATRDGQYTNSGSSDLVRRSAIAQPFDNDYRLGFATLHYDFGGVRLVSNTAFTDHSIDTVFDATRPADSAPQLYDEDMKVSLLTHETRLSGRVGPLSSWVAGVAFAHNVNHVERFLGDPAAPDVLSDVRSTTLDAAAFGEATLGLTDTLAATGGARLSYYRQIEELHSATAASHFEPRRTSWRLLPTAALSWRPLDRLLLFARYQEGYRPGAQRITGEGSQLEAVRYEPDTIATREIGLRFGGGPGAAFSAGLSYAYSRWEDVQADLVTEAGFPYVANIGSGYVRYASANLGWSPVAGWNLRASGFIAASHLDRPVPAFAASADRDLPNIADAGARLSSRYVGRLAGAELTLDGSVGYIGKSRLAIGPPFDRSQGDYLDTSAGARIGFDGWGLSLDLDNLINSRANRFSYGDPFTLEFEDQRTPLRPRTIRIGVDATF